jgi:hypothetical protein
MIEIYEPAAERFGYKSSNIFDVFAAHPGTGYRAFRIHSQSKALVPLPVPMDFRFDAVIVPAWLQTRVDTYASLNSRDASANARKLNAKWR